MGALADFRQYFEVKGEKLYFLDKPIPDKIVKEGKKVLQDFRIPDHSIRSLYESLIFSIANQRVLVERPTTMIMLTHDASLEQLMDVEYVDKKRAEAGCPCKGRFKDALEYVNGYSGGIEKLAEEYLADPLETRRKIVKEVRWVAAKTASLWYLCLGGTKLMCMDVHNYRQIHGLGIDINKHYYLGKPRSDGRSITDTPEISKYEQIEQNVLGRFKDCEATMNGTGIDASLITALFWTFGALTQRGVAFWKGMLDYVPKLDFVPPWSANRDEAKVKGYLERHLKKKKVENPDQLGLFD